MNNVDPTVTAVQNLERRHAASAAKTAELWDELKEARKTRDTRIAEELGDDPNPNLARIAKQFGVSPTWVKKIRLKHATTEVEQ